MFLISPSFGTTWAWGGGGGGRWGGVWIVIEAFLGYRHLYFSYKAFDLPLFVPHLSFFYCIGKTVLHESCIFLDIHPYFVDACEVDSNKHT